MLGGQPNHGWQFAFLFNCTAVGRTSDSMIVPGDGRGLMLWLLSGPPGFTSWISFAPVFSFIYC